MSLSLPGRKWNSRLRLNRDKTRHALILTTFKIDYFSIFLFLIWQLQHGCQMWVWMSSTGSQPWKFWNMKMECWSQVAPPRPYYKNNHILQYSVACNYLVISTTWIPGNHLSFVTWHDLHQIWRCPTGESLSWIHCSQWKISGKYRPSYETTLVSFFIYIMIALYSKIEFCI